MYTNIVCCAFICGILIFDYVNCAPQKRVHVKIHVPIHHHHTKALLVKPKFPHFHHGYHFHHYKKGKHHSHHYVPSFFYKKRPKGFHRLSHRDLALAKLLSNYLHRPAYFRRYKTFRHHFLPKSSDVQQRYYPRPPIIPDAEYIDTDNLHNPDAEYVPRNKPYREDHSYSIGTGYEVEEHNPYDVTPAPYNAFDKEEYNHESKEENHPDDYLDPEKITEYISFIQRGFLNEEDKDFGSDVGEQIERFSKGEYEEGNAHAGSEFEEDKNHLKEGSHATSEYKKDQPHVPQGD